jgi:hypothetical protein
MKVFPLGTKREEETQMITIRLKCNHKGCRKTIQGVEGYNGHFYYRRKFAADLRNQVWVCDEH